MWTVKDDYHTSGAIKALEHNGIPVLISHVGRYPTLVSDEGLTTLDTPYIDISVGGYTRGDQSFYNSVGITVQGQWYGGRRQVLEAWSHKDDDQLMPDALIAEAEKHLDEAVKMLGNLDSLYESAYAQLRPLDELPRIMDREAYINACKELSAEMLSDDNCDSYGVQYGVFEFPEYPPETIIKMSLAYKRLQGIREEQKSAKKDLSSLTPSSPPKQTGQLWEPCPHCGAEPVYMPLMICEECWPK